MEIQFQQPDQHFGSSSNNKKGKSKGRLSNKRKDSNKFVGVRQRPSGRWVAEIKDTTQKIRMWLGTFETAEEAARAYDQAACLLRGSNTRTNFTTHISTNSPLAYRIRNLLNNNNVSKKQEAPLQTRANNSSPKAGFSVTSTSGASGSSSNSSGAGMFESSDQLFDDAYKPDMSLRDDEIFRPEFGFGAVFGQFPLTPQQVLDLSKKSCDVVDYAIESEFSDFERLKVERQISASLYAMNGLQEYMETVHDSSEALWDLSPLCSLLS